MDYGRQNNEKNPFSWHTVRLNLPPGKEYVTSYPWVSKIRKDRNMASKAFIYVDDMRLLR